MKKTSQQLPRSSYLTNKVLPLIWATLFVIVTLFVFTFGSKILGTSFRLWAISFDITITQDDARVNGWNETNQNYYKEDIRQRNELYNTEGFVGWFATASKLIQIPLIILVLIWYSLLVLIPFMYRESKKKNHRLILKNIELKQQILQLKKK